MAQTATPPPEEDVDGADAKHKHPQTEAADKTTTTQKKLNFTTYGRGDPPPSFVELGV